MKRRSEIAMNDAEITQFLGQDGYTLQLATIGADGFPHLVAMWYGMVDGHVYFNTYATSQKAKNLERDPRVTCMIEEGTEYFELRGVVIQGTVERVDDREEISRISRAIIKRYPRPKFKNQPKGTGGVARARVVYRVHPQRVYSWDHRKLPEGVH